MRRRNATATMVVASAATQSISSEPSPPSGAIPNSFSMKSMAISFVQRGGIAASSAGQPEGARSSELREQRNLVRVGGGIEVATPPSTHEHAPSPR